MQCSRLARTRLPCAATAVPVTQARPDIELRALDIGSDREAVAALLADTWSREDP